MYLPAMKNSIKTRLCILGSLVFCIYLSNCGGSKSNSREIVMDWENNQVKKILVPVAATGEDYSDTMYAQMEVRLDKPGAPTMLGNYTQNDEFLVFEPLIPFTGGLKYVVLYKDNRISEFQIPAPSKDSAPAITAIYPSEDSLPENLLKIYIAFSKPMQEGVSADKIVLIKGGTDTLSNVFLDLQPELWNADRTMLTLWLNPGRTKRDLIPNREMGPPLLPNTSYRIYVKPGWQDALGNPVAEGYQKNFLTLSRDMASPNLDYWQVLSPKAGTRQPLILRLREPLDYLVLKNALKVMDEKYNEEMGRVEITDDEKEWRFIPFGEWKAGKYTVMVEPRLEDLAGNNLDRLFDVDLAGAGLQNAQPGITTEVKVVRNIHFQVRE